MEEFWTDIERLEEIWIDMERYWTKFERYWKILASLREIEGIWDRYIERLEELWRD